MKQHALGDDRERQPSARGETGEPTRRRRPLVSLLLAVPSVGAARACAVRELAGWCAEDGVQLVVVTPDACPVATLLGPLADDVRLVAAPPGTSVLDMRRRGIAAGSTDVVLLREAGQLGTPESRTAVREWLEWLRTVEGATADAVLQRRWPHGGPALSVIVPARDASALLGEALPALAGSDLPRTAWELVVVDDGSRDATAENAARHADVLVRIRSGPCGPAYARNRGFELSRAAVLAFVDADVRVHPDTLARLLHALRRDDAVSAVVGSYDSAPPAPGLISQYRNLLRHYVHQSRAGEIGAFWASCGGIRREAFVQVGLFDEWHFARPQVEDLELGARLVRRGHRIRLDPDLQVTHLKRWTLSQMLLTDLRDRGLLWGRLPDRAMSTTLLGVRTEEMASTLLVGVALLTAAGTMLTHGVPWAAAAVLSMLAVLLLNRRLYAFFGRRRGTLFGLVVVPVHLASQCVNGAALLLGRMLRELVGEPRPAPTVEAFAELGVRRWPPVPARPRAPAEGRASETAAAAAGRAAARRGSFEVGITSEMGD